MIFEAIVSVLVGLFTFIGSLMPTMATPAWLSDIPGQVSTVAGQMAALGQWVPFGPAAQATLLVASVAAAVLVIRLVRIVLSLFTGGGGS